MINTRKAATAALTALACALAAASAGAKDAVKVGFIGPLTGGVSVNGIGGRKDVGEARRWLGSRDVPVLLKTRTPFYRAGGGRTDSSHGRLSE